MLQHAIPVITHADRGLLLEPDAGGSSKVRLALDGKGGVLPPESFTPSQTAIRQALNRRSAVITDDLNLADMALQNAQSVVVQRLRAVAVIPLYVTARANPDESMILGPGDLLGVLYLDSRQVTAFSALDRQILDALGAQAASILDNARLVQHERERQRLEQELSIARDDPAGACAAGAARFSAPGGDGQPFSVQ